MAASIKTSEEIKEQINGLKTHIKTNYSNCQSVTVLENMGDYSYVIKLKQFLDHDINLTIQVPTDLNIEKSNICVSSTSASANPKMTDLQTHLIKFLSDNNFDDVNKLIQLFNEAYQFVKHNFETEKSSTITENQKTKSQKSKMKTIENIQDIETPEKKSSMKTAIDVLNRIIWDEQINKEFVTVGYLDRFLGIKECLFSVFDWGDIVEADIGALAIPKHRINYFKYKNEIIWDKNVRLDNIFASTGSNKKIQDIIKSLENVKFIPDESNEEIVHKMGRNNKNHTQRSQPNHFISIPINNFGLKTKCFELICDLLDSNPEIEKYLVPASSYHLTLCTLRLDSYDEHLKVQEILDNIFKDENVLKNFPISLEFKDISEFYNKVLYVKSEDHAVNTKLDDLKNLILEKFRENNINTAGNYYEFVPHLTIFKLAKNNNTFGTETVKSLVKNEIWTDYMDKEFGCQEIKEFQLCEMTNINLSKSYPVVHSVKLD